MRYIVKDTHIRHGEKTYGPGSVVELAEEEAAPLLHHLEPIESTPESIDDGEDPGEDRKRRRK